MLQEANQTLEDVKEGACKMVDIIKIESVEQARDIIEELVEMLMMVRLTADIVLEDLVGFGAGSKERAKKGLHLLAKMHDALPDGIASILAGNCEVADHIDLDAETERLKEEATRKAFQAMGSGNC